MRPGMQAYLMACGESSLQVCRLRLIVDAVPCNGILAGKDRWKMSPQLLLSTRSWVEMQSHRRGKYALTKKVPVMLLSSSVLQMSGLANDPFVGDGQE